MHEFTVVLNLLKILDKICEEKKAERVLNINIKINPYSCLDEDNLNFVFSSMSKGKKIYEGAKINVKKGKDPLMREIIVENIEIEVKNGN